MASEITVTFEDGGVFNGYASSYTKDDTTTYYFEIDKKYRVQVLNSGETITLQQYKNTNGSWYNINIIKSVAITPISGGGGGDVTIEYLQKNYYTKTETDEKYVKKSGDTMTGQLDIKYNGYKISITSRHITLFKNENGVEYTLRLYNGNVFMTGVVTLTDKLDTTSRVKDGFGIGLNGVYRYGELTEPFKFNCPIAFNARTDLLAYMYIRDSIDGSVTGIIQNNANIAMYNGHGFYTSPNTYDKDQFDGVTLSGTKFSGKTLTFSNKVVNQDTITSYSTLSVNPSSGSGGNTVISAGNIIVYSSLNNVNEQRAEISGGGFYHRYNSSGTFMWLRYDYQRYVNSGQTKTEVGAGGIDFYYGAGVTYHSGASGVTEQYTRMNNSGITLYNTTGGTFTINTNGNALTLQSLMGNGATAFRINVPGAHYSLTESGGTVTGTGLYTACNATFYGEAMLNALNQVLTQIMKNIGLTYYVTFDRDPFASGGGSSRGGGVGRR